MDLLQAFNTFTDVAKPIILKSDMLRLGVKFSEAALRDAADREDILFKGFACFAYSRSKTAVYAEKIPEDLYIDDGTPEGTPVQLRLSDDTPYLIDLADGCPAIFWNGEVVGTGRYSPMPRFYRRSLDGFPMASYAHAVGDLLSCSVLKYCEHFTTGKNCLYCDYLPYASTQKKGGEGMLVRKSPEKTAEVLDVAFHSEPRFRHLMFTGGAIVSKYMGKTEIDFYCEFLETVKKRLRHFPLGCLQIGALNDEGWRRVAATGVASVQSNIEVWDKRLFEIICPGKAGAVGYDQWIRRVISSAKFWL